MLDLQDSVVHWEFVNSIAPANGEVLTFSYKTLWQTPLDNTTDGARFEYGCWIQYDSMSLPPPNHPSNPANRLRGDRG